MRLSSSHNQLLQRQVTPGSGLKPPGDCTPGEHAKLQAEVKNLCDNPQKPRSCAVQPPIDSIEEIERRINNNARCIDARNRINSKCFRGGDPGHQKAIELAVNAMGICYKALERARARQPESDRSPTMSPDFVRRISEITGLTGTVLLVYIILSEGSRLFPPRNLIPVP